MAPLRVDTASDRAARQMLRTCCGSARWVERMLARRPFGTEDALLAAARDVWFSLEEADWREAFADHPRIGDRESLKEKFAETRHLAAGEQSGVDGAREDVLEALAEGNAAYERTFGYIFIVCATGLSASEMLARLEARLHNDPADEIRIAAEEQARITELRLLKL